MNKFVTQQELNQLGCAGDLNHQHSHDCATLYLHARCHLKAGTYARYEKLTGILVIECARCKREIVRILVAKEGEKP